MGAGKDGGHHGGLGPVQIFGAAFEIFSGPGLGPHKAGAPIHRVQIDRKNSFFIPCQFNEKGVPDFRNLSQGIPGGREEQGPGRLHGNGAGPPESLFVKNIH